LLLNQPANTDYVFDEIRGSDRLGLPFLNADFGATRLRGGLSSAAGFSFLFVGHHEPRTFQFIVDGSAIDALRAPAKENPPRRRVFKLQSMRLMVLCQATYPRIPCRYRHRCMDPSRQLQDNRHTARVLATIKGDDHVALLDHHPASQLV
jgi:hypothetical protein